ncbi:hypothetical protein QC589_00690 [Halomonas elongata]|uniref:hypothetical protein n=1 Tax=Halomonas elongata TaxID=2746 RepID=UPI00334DC2B4
MAGLDTRGLADGFAQGFGLMDRYYRGQAQQKRADQRMDMQRERMDMQREEAERQREAAQRQEDLQTVQFTLGKIASGMDISDEEVETLKRNPKFWPALDPATDGSIKQAEAVVDPDTPVDANDPESLAALNQLFGSEINKGPGGEKRVVGMVPGPDGESVTLELEVTGEDGKRYNAPMTEGRAPGGDDDTVMQVPVERLVQQTQGMRSIRQAFQTPQAQQKASQVLNLLRGGESEKWELEEHPRLGWVQRNTATGEIQPVKPGAGSPYENRGGDSDYSPTSDMKEARWLVQQGIANDMASAYKMVRAKAGQNQESELEHIEFLNDSIERIDNQLDSYQISEEERQQLRKERESLTTELDEVSRQTFKRPEQNAGDQSQGQGVDNPDQGGTGAGSLQPGHVEDGYEYLGGDPGNPENWRKR